MPAIFFQSAVNGTGFLSCFDDRAGKEGSSIHSRQEEDVGGGGACLQPPHVLLMQTVLFASWTAQPGRNSKGRLQVFGEAEFKYRDKHY